MTSSLLAMLPALLLGQAQAAPSWAAKAIPDGVRLVADVFGAPSELSEVKLGAVNDLVRRGDFVYVALAAGGIVVLDAHNPRAPQVGETFSKDQVVLHLAVEGDELVAVTKGQAFALYDLTDPRAPVAASPRSALVLGAAGPAAQGKVLAVKDGFVIIEGGTQIGFVQGQNVAIYSRTRLSERDRVAQASGIEIPGLLTAIVRLERVQENRSLATFGRGDSPEVGDLVVSTNDSTTANIAGPRWIPFEWRLGLGLRPFLGIQNNGTHPFGLMTDIYIEYYFQEVPLRVGVGLLPIGFVAGGLTSHNPVVFDATVAFYSQFFEIGLGAGFSSTTNCVPLDCTNGNVEGTLDQTLRLGALDGVNFLWSSAIGYATSGFEVAAARGQLNFPLTTRLTLGLEGSGARGLFYGDVVLRTYLGGVGGPGTFILSAGLGGATITDSSSIETVSGPALVFELEARL